MSSSDEGRGAPPSQWGTVFAPSGEHSVGGVERARSTRWSEEDEKAYLDRVKEKASVMAEKIFEDAKAEAEHIREAAREQGYNAGIADAKEELDAFRAGMGDSVSAVLSAIEGQCSHIFDQWREDLVALTRLAVEKGTATILSGEHAAMLETLLTEAVKTLEKRRELVIRVHPEDEPVMADIVNLTKERFPDVSAWRVRADASINAGGLVVESESSLAEGRVESRVAAVNEVLSHLTLPGLP